MSKRTVQKAPWKEKLPSGPGLNGRINLSAERHSYSGAANIPVVKYSK
jgi:hypothetical protein